MTIVLGPATTIKEFSRYDAFLNDQGLLFLEGGDRSTRSVPVESARVFQASNINELTLESGSLFAQGEFFGGMGQVYADRQSSDPQKYYRSIGFDISKGTLRHHRKMVEVAGYGDASPSGPSWSALARLTNHNNKMWMTFFGETGYPIAWSNGELTSWTSEDPDTGSPPTELTWDLTSSGTALYAAQDATGVQKRNGSWAHYGLGTTIAAKSVAWVKNRLVAVAVKSGLNGVYEGTTTTPILEFPAGQGMNPTYGKPFEMGPYVYLPIANADTSGSSIVYHIGLNSAGTALESKGSTRLPAGDYLYTGFAFSDTGFLICGRKVSTSYPSVVIYKASASATGELTYDVIYESVPLTSTEAAWMFTGRVAGRIAYFGYTDNTLGFVGALQYDMGTGAITLGPPISLTAATTQVTSVARFNDRTVIATGSTTTANAAVINYESATLYTPTATYISSIGDGGAPGIPKLWSKLRFRCKPLPAGTTVALYYTTVHPEEDDWTLAGTYSTTGGTGTDYDMDVVSRALAIKIVSTAKSDGTTAPEIEGWDAVFYATDESADDAELELVRTVRIVPNGRKDERARPVPCNVRTVNETVWDELHGQSVWYEPQGTYDVRIEDINEIAPTTPIIDATGGDATKESIVLQLRMRGTMR